MKTGGVGGGQEVTEEDGTVLNKLADLTIVEFLFVQEVHNPVDVIGDLDHGQLAGIQFPAEIFINLLAVKRRDIAKFAGQIDGQPLPQLLRRGGSLRLGRWSRPVKHDGRVVGLILDDRWFPIVADQLVDILEATVDPAGDRFITGIMGIDLLSTDVCRGAQRRSLEG